MKSLIDKWRAEAAELERQARKLDAMRESDSTYYSSMNESQQKRWNQLRNEASNLYLQRNLLNRVAKELELWEKPWDI